MCSGHVSGTPHAFYCVASVVQSSQNFSVGLVYHFELFTDSNDANGRHCRQKNSVSAVAADHRVMALDAKVRDAVTVISDIRTCSFSHTNVHKSIRLASAI